MNGRVPPPPSRKTAQEPFQKALSWLGVFTMPMTPPPAPFQPLRPKLASRSHSLAMQ
ncbi:MAG TPA: hypothetical protein VGC06_29545 [Actinomycetes bacterium]